MLIDRPLDLAYKRATMDMSVTKVGCLSEGRMYYRVRVRENLLQSKRERASPGTEQRAE